MKIFLHKKELIKFIKSENNLGFVPTMGAVHAGHVSIFKRSLSECNKTIVTIFVTINVTIFNNFVTIFATEMVTFFST